VWWLVDCNGAFDEVRQYSPLPPLTDADCPPYYELQGALAATRDEAIVAAGCDGSCVRRVDTAGSFRHCGARRGFDCYLDDDGQCGRLCRFAEGYYPSVEDFVAANPCPDSV